MQRLSEKHGFEVVDQSLRFLRLRLASRSVTKALIEEVLPVRQRLRDTQEAWMEAREARIAQTAEVEYCDEALNLGVMDLSRELLAVVQGKRTDPRFVSLFPVSAGEMVAGVGGSEQARHVQTLIQTLRGSEALSGLQRHADALDAKLTTLEEAVKARDALYVTEAMALAKRNAALSDAKRFYNNMHPRLLLLLDDKPLTESFFAKHASASKRRRDDSHDEGT